MNLSAGRKRDKVFTENDLLSRVFFACRGKNDEQIGDIVGKSRGTVSAWRTQGRRIDHESLEKIANNTATDLDWLLTGKSVDFELLVSFENWLFEQTFTGKELLRDSDSVVVWHIAVHVATVRANDRHHGFLTFVATYLAKYGSSFFKELGVIEPLDEELFYSQLEEQYYDRKAYKWELPDGIAAITEVESIITNASSLLIASLFSGSDNGDNTEPVDTFVVEPDCLPVIGAAAADNSQASRAELFTPDEVEEIQVIKDYHKLIRIYGNSMEPVLLDGQYALIGAEILSHEKIRKSGWIGVVQLDCNSTEFPEPISECGGICTFCKRVMPVGDGSEMLILSSINSAECSPFTVMRKNVLHLWPVNGVFFAGNGVVPED